MWIDHESPKARFARVQCYGRHRWVAVYTDAHHGADCPSASASRYIGTPNYVNPNYLVASPKDGSQVSLPYSEGCSWGLQAPGHSDVILDFGQPWLSQDGTTYGTLLFDGPPNGPTFVSTTQIAWAAEQYLNGFWNCVYTAGNPLLRLAIGTNNYLGQTNNAHGQAWANMVATVNSWLSSNGLTRMLAEGASDLELGFNSPTNTRAWTDGYNAVASVNSGAGVYYEYGDCQGCPSSGTVGTIPGASMPITDPNTGQTKWTWTQDDVYYISWENPAGWPAPEIYNTTQQTLNGVTAGINAWQWEYISKYGDVNNGGGVLYFQDSVTQYQACLDIATQQNPNPCNGVNNTPAQGWTQLNAAMNSDPDTSWGNDVPYGATDFTWQN